ncbi:MAG TPA: WXG100 family type VII secretion target [Tepidisphaeraceae bacterium]|nr:WXG100 family type VII secretion target [Tepidisphaeraceae bacterium]
MGKASVDPTELRRFSQDLVRFNMELQSLMAGLHAKMVALEGTWRDQEQRKFIEAFQQTAKMLGTFLEASQQHAAFLNKKAGLVEEYLRQR